MTIVARLGAVVAVALGLAYPAVASEPTSAYGYGVDSITFERWCLDVQAYDAGRCAARHPGDLSAFETARKRLELFEVEHEREQRQEREFRRTFEAHDAVDRNRRFDF